MNRCRLALISAHFALAEPAQANGAMGLALSIFPYDIWLVYVIAVVLFEALWIGRATNAPFRRSIVVSLGANAVTFFLGIFVSGIFGYILYGALGTRLNPNPFGQAALLLVVGGVVSALVEAPFWKSFTGRTPWRASLAAHLIGVPLALAILLIPSRPYPGLEAQARWRRQQLLAGSDVKRALIDEFQETKRVPDVRTYQALLEHLRPRLKNYGSDPDLWAAAYPPHFERFDMGERKRGPMVEWNAAVAGKKLDELDTPFWLFRFRYDREKNVGERIGEGYIYTSSDIRRSTDNSDLGFVPPTPSPRESRSP